MDYRVEQYIIHIPKPESDIDIEKLKDALRLTMDSVGWSLVSPITVEDDYQLEYDTHETYVHALYIRYPNLVGLTVKHTTTTVFIDEEK